MISEFLKRYPLISEQVDKTELGVILRELERVCDQEVAGDVVEFGCFEGTTALFIRRLLDAGHETRAFHVYDSFAGLPEKSAPDISPAGTQFQPGELAASKSTLIRHFRSAGLEVPIIHKGWFAELAPEQLPGHIAFAFLDGDYYDSILDSLRLAWPHLSQGAVVIIDDYQSEQLPGVQKAVDGWLGSHNARIRVEASLAILAT